MPDSSPQLRCTLFGWYSRLSHLSLGAGIRDRADGQKVLVTGVSQTKEEGKWYNWPDLEFVGMVSDGLVEAPDVCEVPCKDCRGSGQYVGLQFSKPCPTCHGAKMVLIEIHPAIRIREILMESVLNERLEKNTNDPSPQLSSVSIQNVSVATGCDSPVAGQITPSQMT